MNVAIAIWQVLLAVGVGKEALAAKVAFGNSNASYGRRQRGTQSWTPPSNSPSSQVASTPVNYWFKTGVVDEDRGFMQGRAETKKGDQVVGSYQYSDGHVKVKVVYTADQHGYRVIKEERVTMKPPIGSELAFKGATKKPYSPKPRSKPPVNWSTIKDESEEKQQSPFDTNASLGLQIGSFDLKLRTNHGSGGYSHQGLSISPGKSQKHKITDESSGLLVGKRLKTKNPLWEDEDAYNHSLERQNRVRPKNTGKTSYKSPMITPKVSPSGNKPKHRKPKTPNEGLAIFFNDQHSGNVPSLFNPQEATNPVAGPKKRNPRRLTPFQWRR